VYGTRRGQDDNSVERKNQVNPYSLQTCEPIPIHLDEVRLGPRVPIAQALEAIGDRLRTRLTDGTPPVGRSRTLIRLVHPITPVDPLRWLRARTVHGSRAYWETRSGEVRVGTAGTAWVWNGAGVDELFTALNPILEMDRELDIRVMVTGRFDPERPASPGWQEFGTLRASLPTVELRQTGNDHTLVCHLMLDPATTAVQIESVRGELAALAVDREPPQAPTLPPITHPDTSEVWRRALDGALHSIQLGTLDKVVIARELPLQVASRGCPFGYLERLRSHQPGTFRFCVETPSGSAFLGASPELLFRRHGRDLESEALAGTRVRGLTPENDRELAADLLGSDKDLREHRHVLEHVRSRLDPLCTHLESSPTHVHALANVQHLRARFRGRLKESIRDRDILAALHPTPAVCGLPTDAALAAICRLEDFDRGLYGGPIGWFGHRETWCAAAIRCGRLREDDMRLYAGAGIVNGSEAGAEWMETESKLNAFRALADPHA